MEKIYLISRDDFLGEDYTIIGVFKSIEEAIKVRDLYEVNSYNNCAIEIMEYTLGEYLDWNNEEVNI